MSYKITALPGDGIGPEILEGTLKILEKLSRKYNIDYELETYDFGGAAIDNYSDPLPSSTLEACKASDAILLGAIGGPKWNDSPKRPEAGLLALRKNLELFANLRPTAVVEGASKFSPLKEERVKGTDFVIVRELTGGLYFGEPKTLADDHAIDSLTYSKEEIERLAHAAFKLAQSRRKKLTSVDKENVLASSKLWRKTINEVAASYPDVEVQHLLVDACSMHLITNPTQFDVIVTENLFGDILSDEASVIPGSLGVSPSVSYGQKGTKLYEPIHGSAPDIAGKDIANPTGMILSLAMCCKETFNEVQAAEELEAIVYNLLKTGFTTPDLGGNAHTSEIFDKILQQL
ncbi:3-isopropylmalate dehydrogenase [Staphylococcus simulans]|uniref:3-isopropylmalate dehydrogenase n=1 Tax=Staphylococcus simulans TaxID=1286 RepID=UPI003F81B7DE